MMITPIDGLSFLSMVGIKPTPLGMMNAFLKINGKPLGGLGK